MSCATPACFSPYSSWKFLIFLVYMHFWFTSNNKAEQYNFNHNYNNSVPKKVNRWYRIRTMALCTPAISIIIWKEDTSFPAMFNPLYSSINQQLVKKNFCNQSRKLHSVRNGSHHMPTTKSTHFVISKDEWESTWRMHCTWTTWPTYQQLAWY